MKRQFFLGCLLLAVCSAAIAAKATTNDSPVSVVQNPLTFEENRGQSAANIRYSAKAKAYQVELDASGAHFVFNPAYTGATPFSLLFEGPGKQVSIAGEGLLPGKTNYFPASDPASWITDVPTFSRIRYQQIYSGVDAVFRGNPKNLEYDLVVKAGADPGKIVIGLAGSVAAFLNAAGDLVINTGSGKISFLKPIAYQLAPDGSSRLPVASSYVLDQRPGSPVKLRFAIGAYDHSRELVIDPSIAISYSEYVDAYAGSVAVDSTGNTYVAGSLRGAGGALYITKYNTSGAVVYNNIFGTGSNAWIYGIAVDSAGKAYVTGESYKTSTIPVSANAYSSTNSAGYDSFVAVFSAAGTGLVYGSYLGGVSDTSISWGSGVAVDPAGKFYISGNTNSSAFQTTPGAYQTAAGSSSAFVAKFDPTQSSASATLVYSTLLGPTGTSLNSIGVSQSGNAYITGTAPSSFPVTNGAFRYVGYKSPYGGVYVTELNTTGTALVYSAYLGYGTGYGIAVEGQTNPNVYVTGIVSYPDFPTTAGAYQSTYAGGFLVKLNPTGSGEVYSTFLGGPSSYDGTGVTPLSVALPYGCASACNAYVAGWTNTDDFPAVNAIQTVPSTDGNYTAFVAEIGATGQGAILSTYLSGLKSGIQNNHFDSYGKAPALAVDGPGNISFIANINSDHGDTPTTVSGSNDLGGFVARIASSSAGLTLAQPTAISFGNQPVGVSTSVYGGTATAIVRNLSSSAATLTQPIQVSPGSIFSESDNCGTAIPPGGSCILNLDFKPAAPGARAGSVTVTSNAPNSPISIALSGTGQDTALVEPSGNALTFGVTAVGSASPAQTFVLTNLGDLTSSSSFAIANPDFTQLNNCPPQLAPGANCTVYVTFKPSTPGLSTTTLVVYNSSGPNASVSLTGTAEPASAANPVVLSATTLGFGSQIVSTTSAAQSLYITNNGSSPITIQSAAVTGDFSLSDYCGLPLQLNPQQYCRLSVSFSPTVAGLRSGTLTITSTANTGTQSVSLGGTGLASVSDVDLYPAAAVTFPDTAAGVTSTLAQTIYLENSGTASLTVYRVLVSGDFNISSDGCSTRVVAGGATDGQPNSYYNCPVVVKFTPTAAGVRTGTLTFVDSAPGSPHVVTLSGKGLTATGAVALNPVALNFGSQPQGITSTYQSFYFVNPGNTPVTVNGFSFSGDYSLNYSNCGNPPITLSPGYANCFLQVQFTPTATGSRTGSATVVSSAGNQSVSLTGTGVAASMTIGLTPTSMNLGPLVVNTRSNYESIYVRNTGTAPVSFTSNPALNGTNASDFVLSLPNCANSGNTLQANASCSFSVAFNPTASGTRTATLSLTDSAGTQTINLTGTGVSTAPAISLSDYIVSFGSQVLSASNPQNYVRLYNKGTTSLALGSVTASGDFLIVHGYDGCSTTTVAAGGSCQVAVSFAPTVAGYRTGSLIFNNSSGTPLSGVPSVPLAGFAVSQSNAASASPVATNFTAKQVVGTTSPYQTVYLYNNGNTALAVGSLSGSNVGLAGAAAEFSYYSANNGSDSCGGKSVAPGSNCAVRLTFTPNAAGARTGTLNFPVTYSNGSTATVSESLTGTGVNEVDSPVANPNSVSFVDQAVSTTSSYNTTVLLTNKGNLPFSVGTVSGSNLVAGSSSTGEFSLSTANGGRDACSGATVQPDSYCYLNVTFTPSASGPRTGSITMPVTFASHATSSVTVGLTGTGVAAAKSIQIAPGNIQFPSQVQTKPSASQTVIVSNTGNVSVAFGSDTISTNSAEFRITSDGCTGVTLIYGQSCVVKVAFTPLSSSTGLRTGTLTIADNASGGPHAVALSGNAVSASQVIVLSQTSVAFGSQPAGSASSIQYVYVTNQSDSGVPLTSAVLSGANAGDFILTSSCPSNGNQLPGRATCYLGLKFSPAAGVTGSRVATLTETDSASGSPRTVALSGTASAPGPAIAFTPANYNFGTVTVGVGSNPANFSVTNTGTTNLAVSKVAATNTQEFPLVSDGCSGVTLAPRSQCVVSVRFQPTLGGARSGSLTITDNAPGSSQTFGFSGTGFGVPRTAFNPASLTFAGQNIGSSSASQSVSLSNPGTDTLNIASISVTGANAADFTQTNNCSTRLAPGSSCTISVSFKPAAAGSRGAAIMVGDNANNAAGSTQSIALAGTGVGVPAASVSPTSLTFASTNIGASSSTMTTTLANSGTGALTIAGISLSGTNAADFQQTNNCGSTLAAGSSCVVSVKFTPSAVGSRSASLAISDNANNVGGSIQTVALSGTGAGVPSAAINPSFLGYGDQTVGTSSVSQAITLSNSGTAPLAITSITSSGTNASDFTQTNNCGSSLAAAASCTISVTFKPSASGGRQANLVVTDNSKGTAGATQSTTLYGVGN